MTAPELQTESERCREDALKLRNAGGWEEVAAVLADHFERRAAYLHTVAKAAQDEAECIFSRR